MTRWDLLYLSLLGLGWPLAVPFALFNRKFRTGFAEKMGHYPAITLPSRPAWIHAASVGEVTLAAQFIREVKKHRPELSWIITTNTPTGRENAAKSLPEVPCFYCPLDFSFAVKRFLKKAHPAIAVFVELEAWPNIQRHLEATSIPSIVINGRISDRSFPRYLRLRPFLSPTFRRFDRVQTLDATVAERFRAMGCEPDRVEATGSMKFDLPMEESETLAAPRRQELNLPPKTPVLIGGSIHPGEETVLLNIHRELRRRHPETRLILIPRHVEKKAEFLSRLKEAGAEKICCYSEWPQGRGLEPGETLLLDKVGLLKSFYALGTVVFVGGTLTPRGGQNMLEPIALGKPTIVGPRTENFRQIMETLRHAQAILEIQTAEELQQRVLELFDNPELAKRLAVNGEKTLLSHRGATQKNVAAFLNLLSQIR